MSQEINFVSPIISSAGKLVLLGIASMALMVLDNRYAALQQAKCVLGQPSFRLPEIV